MKIKENFNFWKNGFQITMCYIGGKIPVFINNNIQNV